MSALLSSLAFTTPLALAALAALPVIWWLLRFTPPRPRRVRFPPFRLLLDLIRKDEQPQHTPWWILLLRLAMATAVILAVAGPVLNATGVRDRSADPLLIVADTGWASAPDWQLRADLMRDVLQQAGRAGAPAAVVTTTQSPQPGDVALSSAEDVLERVAAIQPHALQPDRGALVPRLRSALADVSDLRVLWLSDGLIHERDAGFARQLTELAGGRARVEVLLPPPDEIAPALAAPEIDGARLKVRAVRADSRSATRHPLSLRARNGRVLAETELSFELGQVAADAAIELPLELRNEAARLELTDVRSAGAVFLFDDRWQRKSVAMLSGAALELEQPLLSPLYYVSRALLPSAELHDIASLSALPDTVDDGVSMLVLADIGVLGPDNLAALDRWIERGGMLVRFAGPRLAGGHDDLVPVELRSGGRALGSALSWDEPQGLAPFAENSPFAGLAADPTVKVRRQVLAEPSAALPARVWASLEDGTPLVTGQQRGKGLIVLFHTTANADWSNLPLSGMFVEMLKRLADLAPAAGALASDNAASAADNAAAATGDKGAFTPLRTLNGFGELVAPPASAVPVENDRFFDMQPEPRHPAGIYTRGGARHALNLDAASGGLQLLPADLPDVTVSSYERAQPTELAGWLFALAAALFALDCLAMLHLTGALATLQRFGARTVPLVALAVLLGGADSRAVLAQQPAQTNTVTTPANAAEQFAMQASLETRIGYVLTGDADVDSTSRLGMMGLGTVLIQRTSIEPAEPVAIDIEKDDIAFFPIIYWPVTPDAETPSPAVLAKLSDFMKNGGTVFFDTREDNASLSELTGGASPSLQALRRILDSLDVPALEPVPDGHVLTRAFYLLNQFPGRWAGGQLWVEARSSGKTGIDAAASDGVSSIIIGSNDYAAAWALDASGQPQYPVSPGGEGQREFAWRTGINIMMYALTGNYKADQVHVPALLERLGQ